MKGNRIDNFILPLRRASSKMFSNGLVRVKAYFLYMSVRQQLNNIIITLDTPIHYYNHTKKTYCLQMKPQFVNMSKRLTTMDTSKRIEHREESSMMENQFVIEPHQQFSLPLQYCFGSYKFTLYPIEEGITCPYSDYISVDYVPEYKSTTHHLKLMNIEIEKIRKELKIEHEVYQLIKSIRRQTIHREPEDQDYYTMVHV